MKLSPRDANAYFAKPDPARAGLLIYGADAMRVAMKRQQVIGALIGPKGDEEMRLTRIPAADLRKDPAQLLDAIKAVGFFSGARAAFVEGANDQAHPAIEAALKDWAEGDAQIIVTAGQLKPTSKLRKLFEGHKNALAAAIYDDPPDRDEINRMFRETGLEPPQGDAMGQLMALSRELDPGDFRQMLEKLAIYKLGDDATLSTAEIALLRPQSTEAGADDLIDIVAGAEAHRVSPVLARLNAQGVAPVTMCIAAGRHFRTLHTIAADPGGPGAGIGKVFPRVFGPRRDRLLSQANGWGARKIEAAQRMILDTDLQLRSAGQTAPALALVERLFIRLAMFGAQR